MCARVCVRDVLFSLVCWVADGLTFVCYLQISTDVQHTISSNNKTQKYIGYIIITEILHQYNVCQNQRAESF